MKASQVMLSLLVGMTLGGAVTVGTIAGVNNNRIGKPRIVVGKGLEQLVRENTEDRKDLYREVKKKCKELKEKIDNIKLKVTIEDGKLADSQDETSVYDLMRTTKSRLDLHNKILDRLIDSTDGEDKENVIKFREFYNLGNDLLKPACKIEEKEVG